MLGLRFYEYNDSHMSTKFIKTVEDFTCEKCGTLVKGNGYTNHCPVCLYSKHVDNYPGDRAAECQGMMQPIGIDMKKGDYVVIHQCLRCGTTRRNKVNAEDDMEKVLEIARLQAKSP